MTEPSGRRLLDRVLDDIHKAGLKVNNLFQQHNGQWQANLRDDEFGHQFGQGATMEAALMEAFWKAINSPGTPIRKGTALAEIETRTGQVTVKALDDLGL